MAGASIIGIDLGGTRIKAGVVNDGRIKELKILSTCPGQELKSLLPELKDEILRLSQKEQGSIRGIGFAFPGIVDTQRNCVVETSAKYEDAADLDMVKWAKELFGLPLKMDNDARLACLGEWCYGAGKGTSDMVMMTLGTGVGTAAVINNTLLRGKQFRAGILGGHMVIDYKNQTNRCSCGRYGCVEAAASMWRIQDIVKAHTLYKESVLSSFDYISWEILVESAKQGDKLAEMMERHCLEVWAVGMINLVHAYDPERVVIGGGISNTEDIILPYFREALESRSWYRKSPEIKMGEFPDSSALLGSEALFE